MGVTNVSGLCDATNQSWFSEDFKEQALSSLTQLCLDKVIAKRDETFLETSQSGWIVKGVVYLTAEIAFILLIPVALIESAFRSAMSWITYPLAATGLISDDKDDAYSKALVTGSILSTRAGLGAFHSAFLGLNPKRAIGNPLRNIEIYFPIFGTSLSLVDG